MLSGRKSLHAVARDGYSEIDSDKITLGGKDKYDNPISKPKMLAMAAPAFFLLCCTLVCPCFQARKKDSGHTLSREPNSSELHPSPTLLRCLLSFILFFVSFGCGTVATCFLLISICWNQVWLIWTLSYSYLCN